MPSRPLSAPIRAELSYGFREQTTQHGRNVSLSKGCWISIHLHIHIHMYLFIYVYIHDYVCVCCSKQEQTLIQICVHACLLASPCFALPCFALLCPVLDCIALPCFALLACWLCVSMAGCVDEPSSSSKGRPGFGCCLSWFHVDHGPWWSTERLLTFECRTFPWRLQPHQIVSFLTRFTLQARNKADCLLANHSWSMYIEHILIDSPCIAQTNRSILSGVQFSFGDPTFWSALRC